MTDFPGEVAGLPAGGPATRAGVKVYLGIAPEDVAEDDRIDMYVAAINAQVRTWRTAEKSVDQAEWNPATVLGATMLAVRLDGRRNSPLGVATFGSEGPLYVQRNDPDIAAMLDLGANAKPAVG